MSAEGAAQTEGRVEARFDEWRPFGPQRLEKTVATTPSRAWLLNAGPWGLNRRQLFKNIYKCEGQYT